MGTCTSGRWPGRHAMASDAHIGSTSRSATSSHLQKLLASEPHGGGNGDAVAVLGHCGPAVWATAAEVALHLDEGRGLAALAGARGRTLLLGLPEFPASTAIGKAGHRVAQPTPNADILLARAGRAEPAPIAQSTSTPPAGSTDAHPLTHPPSCPGARRPCSSCSGCESVGKRDISSSYVHRNDESRVD